MSYVNMRERDVLARYRAKGQMNYLPGVWDPCWSRGQLLIYEDDLPCFRCKIETFVCWTVVYNHCTCAAALLRLYLN